MALQVSPSPYNVASIPKVGGDITRFIASRQATEWQFASAFGEDEHPSVVVREHSEPGDRIGEVYARMRNTDAILAGLLEKRVKAVLGLPWDVVPANESPEAQQVADFARQAIYGIRNIEVNLAHQLSAVSDGCAFDEMRWERQTRGPLAGLWTVVELVDRPMWRFGFKQGALHVRTKQGQLAPVPPGRILHLCYGTKDTPWGAALLDRVWWFYYLSLHAWKYYSVFLEKFAQPTVLAKYQRGADEKLTDQAKADALAAAADIQTEYAISVPADVEIELKEAMRSGGASYEQFIALLDRAKALVFLGEVDTSGLAKGPGSFAKSRVSNDVRYETILADACVLANSLTDGLIAPMVRVNFGPDAPLPYWEFDVLEADDREMRRAGAEAVLNAGLPLARRAYYRVNQQEPPKPGEETITRSGIVIGQIATAVNGATAGGAQMSAEPDWADQELTN